MRFELVKKTHVAEAGLQHWRRCWKAVFNISFHCDGTATCAGVSGDRWRLSAVS